MNKVLIGVLVVAILGFAYAHSSPTHSAGAITIGAVISKTGFAAEYGDMAEMAMRLAVEEINADGGSVSLIVEDDETNPTKTVSAYRKLVDIDHVDAVVGSIFDFTTQPLLPLALKDKEILVVPTQPTIKGSFEMNAQTFSMLPPFEKIVLTLEPVIVGDADATKLGILRYQSDFGKEIERVLGTIATSHDLAFVVQSYEKIGAGDFRTQILKLKSSGVDVLFLDMLTPDVVTFKKQASELGYSPRVISYSHFDAVVTDQTNAALYEGDYWLDWQDTASAEFAKRFENKYGIAPRRGAEASYKATYLLTDALGEADSLKSLGTNFTPDHTLTSTRVTISKYTNGSFVPLAQIGE